MRLGATRAPLSTTIPPVSTRCGTICLVTISSQNFNLDLTLTNCLVEMEKISEICMNEPRFMGLLEKLIGESKHLQNNPSQGLVPKEDLACAHIMRVLGPYSKENGGPLEISKVNFVEDRGNLIIRYPGTNPSKICSFVGSHMDVVPASPEGWARDPFKLEVDGDTLYGRGTTDW